jgi:hypothetical protein
MEVKWPKCINLGTWKIRAENLDSNASGQLVPAELRSLSHFSNKPITCPGAVIPKHKGVYRELTTEQEAPGSKRQLFAAHAYNSRLSNASRQLLVQVAGEILEACIDGDGCHYLARPEFSRQLERANQIETR